VPEPLECLPEERSKNIRIGTDGLVIEYHGRQGLLLPQVATENNFSVEDFLECLANKAGVASEAVLSPEAKILTFQAEIWHEETPNGAIINYQ
ncbi:MAG: AMMECR1 domain-containing protein, partial [Waddliaceae bacterium]|nr:AMMECR1 domain-containing protein [Waddliaceae bacterium]